jgi:hypothetical protein
VVGSLFLFSVAALVFIYRIGSARVDRGTEPGMRDLGTYLMAGSNFLQGVDPYSDPAMRLGPSLLPFFGILDFVLPKSALAIAFQILAMLGLLFLVNSLTGLSFRDNLPIYLAICWFSATRENLVNIQITGLLALLAGCGIRLVKNSTSKIVELVGCFMLVLALDTKPHIFVLISIIFLVIEKKVKLIWSIFGLLALNHSILSLINGNFLSLSWLRTLLGLYDAKSQGELGESLVIWPLLERLGVDPKITSFLSIALFLILIFYFLTNMHLAEYKSVNYYLMALTFPSIGIFFHYYDIAIAISIFFAYVISSNRLKVALVALPFALVPSGVENLRNTAIIVGILIFLKVFQKQFSEVKLRTIGGSLAPYLIYSLILKYLVEVDLKQQFQVTFAALSLIIISFTLKFQDRKTVIPRKME